jgi:hypothetical protein
MGVVLGSMNEYDKLFEKGRVLPATEKRDYQTIVRLEQGQSGDVLKIPVVEGEKRQG